MYDKISKHVRQRYKDRGLKSHTIKRDLSLNNVKTMITKPDGSKVVYTKNKLRYIIEDRTVVTIMKIKPENIKREMKKYGYMA